MVIPLIVAGAGPRYPLGRNLSGYLNQPDADRTARDGPLASIAAPAPPRSVDGSNVELRYNESGFVVGGAEIVRCGPLAASDEKDGGMHALYGSRSCGSIHRLGALTSEFRPQSHPREPPS